MTYNYLPSSRMRYNERVRIDFAANQYALSNWLIHWSLPRFLFNFSIRLPFHPLPHRVFSLSFVPCTGTSRLFFRLSLLLLAYSHNCFKIYFLFICPIGKKFSFYSLFLNLLYYIFPYLSILFLEKDLKRFKKITIHYSQPMSRHLFKKTNDGHGGSFLLMDGIDRGERHMVQFNVHEVHTTKSIYTELQIYLPLSITMMRKAAKGI